MYLYLIYYICINLLFLSKCICIYFSDFYEWNLNYVLRFINVCVI